MTKWLLGICKGGKFILFCGKNSRRQFFFRRQINSVAQKFVGRMFERGEHVEKNFANCLKMARGSDERFTQHRRNFKLAKMHYFGNGVGTEKNLDAAKELQEKLKEVLK